MAEQVNAIDPGILRIEGNGDLTLIGGRRADGRLVFPRRDTDPDCREEDLPRTGTLWSWTVQRFRPKSPPYEGSEDFAPYAVGYVDLGEIIVESRLKGPWDGFRIGMPMKLVPEAFALADGNAATTFAFTPAGDAK